VKYLQQNIQFVQSRNLFTSSLEPIAFANLTNHIEYILQNMFEFGEHFSLQRTLDTTPHRMFRIYNVHLQQSELDDSELAQRARGGKSSLTASMADRQIINTYDSEITAEQHKTRWSSIIEHMKAWHRDLSCAAFAGLYVHKPELDDTFIVVRYGRREPSDIHHGVTAILHNIARYYDKAYSSPDNTTVRALRSALSHLPGMTAVEDVRNATPLASIQLDLEALKKMETQPDDMSLYLFVSVKPAQVPQFLHGTTPKRFPAILQRVLERVVTYYINNTTPVLEGFKHTEYYTIAIVCGDLKNEWEKFLTAGGTIINAESEAFGPLLDYTDKFQLAFWKRASYYRYFNADTLLKYWMWFDWLVFLRGRLNAISSGKTQSSTYARINEWHKYARAQNSDSSIQLYNALQTMVKLKFGDLDEELQLESDEARDEYMFKSVNEYHRAFDVEMGLAAAARRHTGNSEIFLGLQSMPQPRGP